MLMGMICQRRPSYLCQHFSLFLLFMSVIQTKTKKISEIYGEDDKEEEPEALTLRTDCAPQPFLRFKVFIQLSPRKFAEI